MTFDRADQVPVHDQPNQKNDCLSSKISAEMGTFINEKKMAYQSTFNPQDLGFPNVALNGQEKPLPLTPGTSILETNGVMVSKDRFGTVQKFAATSIEHTFAHPNITSKAIPTAEGWALKINKGV